LLAPAASEAFLSSALSLFPGVCLPPFFPLADLASPEPFPPEPPPLELPPLDPEALEESEDAPELELEPELEPELELDPLPEEDPDEALELDDEPPEPDDELSDDDPEEELEDEDELAEADEGLAPPPLDEASPPPLATDVVVDTEALGTETAATIVVIGTGI
jgi:hypothetical protein